METLSKLFGGENRVKVLRLFLFNPEGLFSLKQIADKAKMSSKSAKSEVDVLQKAGMVRERKVIQTLETKKRGKILEIKKKVICWHLDPGFEYLLPLQNLLINTRPLRPNEILKRLSNVGKLKMIIVSGVFIQNPDSRVDLLVVGDNLRKGSIERIVKTMEAEIGKELTFASFETADFHYRLGMYDKLIRDILDYPHQKLLDKLNIKTS
jgi:DNA-binding MarR family transcriptional regulator